MITHWTAGTLMFTGILFLIIACAGSRSSIQEESNPGDTSFSTLTGPYLGQEPPGLEPALFAHSRVSTGRHESAIVFSADGREAFYGIMHLTHGFYVIVTTRESDGGWTTPEVLPFSGRFNDSDPFLSHDGSQLFFTSDRPREVGGQAGNLDLWVAEREGLSWGEPASLEAHINSQSVDVNPCVSRSGTLYFASDRSGGQGSHDLYRSVFRDGAYSVPENLGQSVNTSAYESSPFVDPDETFLIYNVYSTGNDGRESGLHVSFRLEDGGWSEGIYMGDAINDLTPAMFPFVSRDGRYFFYTSTRAPDIPYQGPALDYDQVIEMMDGPQNGTGDIYWVSAQVLDELRRRALGER
jgi:Tol biopolymer transport system component